MWHKEINDYGIHNNESTKKLSQLGYVCMIYVKVNISCLKVCHCLISDKMTKLVRDDNGLLLSGEPDYFGRNKISSGGDLSHYSSASLY